MPSSISIIPPSEHSTWPVGYAEDDRDGTMRIDFHILDQLKSDSVHFEVYQMPSASERRMRTAVYTGRSDITLHELIPVMHSLGVDILEESTRSVRRPDGLRCTIYDLGLRLSAPITPTGNEHAYSTLPNRFVEAIQASRRGDMECDNFNHLITGADLDWKQTTILRAYAHYLKQIRFPYSQQRIEIVMLENVDVARSLVELFESRFAPGLGSTMTEDHVASLIHDVLDLEADRILQAYLELIKATTRTSYFIRSSGDDSSNHLTLKIDTRSIQHVPEPRPAIETYVYSTSFEGTHLRFGSVARGGIRWSDRLEDYRTEILGLAKAQAVKNAVIVPVGAKGGFVVKNVNRASALEPPTRDEGRQFYQAFVSALLEIADNIDPTLDSVAGHPDVRAHDGEDPYLVVAADKGTASFSDIANSVSARSGFWLGDAFASGGSHGYDHKKMGITARGAWESVRYHFRERSVDVDTDPITVVGIGDMAGDVFGNGLLSSSSVKLIAAFDHRHIFIDPSPDPEASYAQRLRLFGLAHSSWDDYPRSAISTGGGVFRRAAKNIDLSPEAWRALGIDAEAVSVTPHELVRHILLAPADLLWNGGIGTYVKGHAESHVEVGDKANDNCRVDARDLRVRVIGEGGNLGVTPRGRVEFAYGGGAVNTDAVDNSAGVDCSDHEVNLKIALSAAVRDGAITALERDALLDEMTDAVAEKVLRNNTSQNRLLGTSRTEAQHMLPVHGRLITHLVSVGQVDRDLDSLPSKEELAARSQAGMGLTSPELATLSAHVKLAYKKVVGAHPLAHDPVFDPDFLQYFPDPIRSRLPQHLDRHPLRGAISTNVIVNSMIDTGGITFAFRLGEETGADPTDALRAHRIVTTIFALPRLWADIRTAGLPTAIEHKLVIETRRILDRAARWLLTKRPQPLNMASEIERYLGIEYLAPHVGRLVRGSEAAAVRASTERWLNAGVPIGIASRTSELLYLYSALDIFEVALLKDREISRVAALYFALSEYLSIDALLIQISELPRNARWDALARLTLRDDLYRSLRTITIDVLDRAGAITDPDDAIAKWENENGARLARSKSALTAIESDAMYNLTTLTVAVGQIRSTADDVLPSA